MCQFPRSTAWQCLTRLFFHAGLHTSHPNPLHVAALVVALGTAAGDVPIVSPVLNRPGMPHVSDHHASLPQVPPSNHALEQHRVVCVLSNSHMLHNQQGIEWYFWWSGAQPLYTSLLWLGPVCLLYA
jgi:hypothetical protein